MVRPIDYLINFNEVQNLKIKIVALMEEACYKYTHEPLHLLAMLRMLPVQTPEDHLPQKAGLIPPVSIETGKSQLKAEKAQNCEYNILVSSNYYYYFVVYNKEKPTFRFLDYHSFSQIKIKFNVGCFLLQKELMSMSRKKRCFKFKGSKFNCR